VEATRRQYEKKLADKDSEVARREAEVRRQEKAVAEAKNAVDDKIAEGIRKEREKIANEEARKARLLVSDQLQGKSKAIAELEEILKTKDGKLAEAQKAQAELVRKRRELDDAKRELDLTVETRVLQSGGSRSYARISGQPRLILLSWFLVCCPKVLICLITLMVYGYWIRNVSFHSRSHFANP
jgi:thymidylate synthase ThyX